MDYDKKRLDAKLIKTCMDLMDEDVALRFVLSGLSMSSVKIQEAFTFACKEMEYREEERAKAELKKKMGDSEHFGSKSGSKTFDKKGQKSTNEFTKAGEDIIKMLEDLFKAKPGSTKK